MHSHTFKNGKSLDTTQQLKKVVNASRNLALMSMQCKEKKNPKHKKEVSFHYNAPVMVDSVSKVKCQHDMGTISFKSSILIFSFLSINNLWMISTNLNKYFIENGIMHLTKSMEC